MCVHFHMFHCFLFTHALTFSYGCCIKIKQYFRNTHDFMEKLIKQGKVEKELKPAPKPNVKILAALNKLLISSLKVKLM